LIEQEGEGGTTEIPTENAVPGESPTEAQTDPTPTPSAEITNATTEPQSPAVTADPIRGAWIPHTEAMLALRERCKNLDEEWMRKIDEVLGGEVYENDGVRKGELYYFLIFFTFGQPASAEDVEHMLTSVGVELKDPFLKESYELFAFYGTPEQLELLVKNNGDRIDGISFAYMGYDL
jgi:hypothetical protein